MEPEVQSTASKASRNNNVDEEEDLEAALAKIRDALQSTSSRPGYLHLRHSLLYADDDVQIVQDPSAPSAEEKLKLKQSLVRIRTLIFKAAERFDVSYKEILAKAVTMAKEDHKKTNSPPPPAAATVERVRLSVSSPLQSSAPQSNSSQQQQETSTQATTPQSPHHHHQQQQQQQQLQRHQLQQQQQQQQQHVVEVPDIFTPGIVMSQKSVKNVKTIMKLKHWKKAIKYAIWDFQDGRTIEVAADKFKVPPDHVRYSIDMIRDRTGETIVEFQKNRSLDLDSPSFQSPEYQDRLRQAVNELKQQKESSLIAKSRLHQVTFFDLVDKIITELEIENKICNLQPVEVVTVPSAAAAPAAPSSVASSSGGHPEPDHDDILSDIDEVIRNDTSLSAAAGSPNASVAPSGSGGGGGGTAEVQAVFVANICEVCKRVFLDQNEFRNHVEAGCLDY